MNPVNSDLYTLFSPQNIVAVPEYQRNYSWGVDQWHFLVRDILTAGTSNKPKHWLGIILIDKPVSVVDRSSLRFKKYIIDGQQRLVTLRIWLAALKHHAEQINQQFSAFETAEFQVQKSDEEDFNLAINNRWMYCPREKFNQGPLGAYYYFRWLLWLGEEAILSELPLNPPKYNAKNRTIPPEELWEKMILRNSKSTNQIACLNRSAVPNINELYVTTLQRLYATFLEIDPTIDEEPSLVFETLNAKRLQLEPFDHVRNRVFMLLQEELKSPDLVSDFYQNKWQPAEAEIEKIRLKRVKNITAFLYDFLISKGEKKRQEISTKNTAAAFEQFLQNKRSSSFLISRLLEDEFLPAMHLWLMAKGIEKQATSRASFVFQLNNDVSYQLIESINSLSDGPPVPLVLHYLICLHTNLINEQELIDCLKIIEGLLIRLMLNGGDFSPNRSRFMQICASVDQNSNISKLKEAISPIWPKDESIISRNISDPIYARWKKDLGPLLRGIERAQSGQHSNWVPFGNGTSSYSVEHIAPQKLNNAWETDLKSWKVKKDEFQTRIDSLGNLTIVSNSHNSSVKNNSFEKKKAYFQTMGAGAPMKINNSWVNDSKWTVKSIDDRTKLLREIAINYWKI